MTRHELLEIGVPSGELLGLASFLVRHASQRGLQPEEIRRRLRALVERPEQCLDDPCFGSLARALMEGDESA